MYNGVYGFCPLCGSPGIQRERRPNGNDICQLGHRYPSNNSVNETQSMKLKILQRITDNDGLLLSELNERLGDEPERWVD